MFKRIWVLDEDIEITTYLRRLMQVPREHYHRIRHVLRVFFSVVVLFKVCQSICMFAVCMCVCVCVCVCMCKCVCMCVYVDIKLSLCLSKLNQDFFHQFD